MPEIDIDRIEFGKRLKYARTKKGLARDRLARALNVTVNAVRHWEHGIRLPDLPMLTALAQELEVNPAYLLGLSEYRPLGQEVAKQSLLGPETLKEIYEHLERLRLALQKALAEKSDWDVSLPGIPGAVAEELNGVVKITVPDVPPNVKALSLKTRNEVRKRWMEWIVYACSKAKIKAKFEQAVVLIKLHMSPNQSWDVDNRTVKGIIDGVRYARLISDDSYQYLTYMVMGEATLDRHKTEIYVTNIQNMDVLLKASGINNPSRQ